MQYERLGRYELIKRLARGGMAEVHLARTGAAGVEKIVVVKRMLAQHASNDDFIGMFLDEARVAIVLNHPNVVQTYDFGVEEGRHYLAMEYLHGEDLRTIVATLRAAKRKMPPSIALYVIAALCAGLHHAHEAVGNDGQRLFIVHRDVSPHNAIVTFDGAVKVFDFGIAQASNRTSHTRDGTLKGKIAYMSPEQLRGESIDRRTDVYAVGVMLYELLLDQRPYRTTTPGEFALMVAIVGGEVRPPREIDPAFPAQLEKIILRALAREREQRYDTAHALQLDIEAWMRSEGIAVSASDLSAFMRELFGARLEAWRSILATGADIGAHIQEIERSRVEVHEEDVVEVDVEEPAPEATKAEKGSDVAVSRRSIGETVVVSLKGRLNESFRGSVVGASFADDVILDLRSVERITSFGVREWLSMLAATRDNIRSLHLVRCSEAVVDQLSMIRGFAGEGRIVSFFAPYTCEQCGSAVERLIDVERDAQALRAGKAPETTCTTCGGHCSLDDDPSVLSFVRPHLGHPTPAHVRMIHEVLVEEERRTEGTPVEMVVDGQTTVLRMRALDRSIRWSRVLGGLEGALLVEIDRNARTTPEGIADFLSHFRRLPADVTSVQIAGAPVELAASLRRAELTRFSIESVAVHGQCSACRATRVALVASSELVDGVPPTSCRRCGESVAFESLEGIRQDAPLPSRSVPPAPPVAAPLSQRGPSRPVVPIAIAVLSIALVLATLLRREPVAAPKPASAAPSTSASSASWIEQRLVVDAGFVTVVGRAAGASDDEASELARADAERVLAVAILDRLEDADLRAFINARLSEPSSPQALRGLAARWTRQLGERASLERIDGVLRRSGSSVEAIGRYRVGRPAFDAAVAMYGRTRSLLGMTVAPLHPLLASATTKWDWIVTAVDPAGPTKGAGVEAGDVLASLEGNPVRTLDAAIAAVSGKTRVALGIEHQGVLRTVEVKQ